MATIKVDPKTGAVIIECDDDFLLKYLAASTESIAFAPAAPKSKAGPGRPAKAGSKKRGPKKSRGARKGSGRRGATAAVLEMVQKSKNGISVSELVAKTGSTSNQKIYNILSKAKKEGKIASAGKGMYKPA